MSVVSTPPSPRTLLSMLWVFFLLNIFFRDIHQFLSPGNMAQVIAGDLFGQEVTDALLLYGGFAVEVMLLMVIAPFVLPRSAVRIVNPIAVAFTAGLVAFTPPIDPDDVFFLVIGLITLIGIAWVGWARFAPDDSRQADLSAVLGIAAVLAILWFGWTAFAPMDIRLKKTGL